ISFNTVDLPQPDGPINDTNSPSEILKLMSSRTLSISSLPFWNDLLTFSKLTFMVFPPSLIPTKLIRIICRFLNGCQGAERISAYKSRQGRRGSERMNAGVDEIENHPDSRPYDDVAFQMPGSTQAVP